MQDLLNCECSLYYIEQLSKEVVLLLTHFSRDREKTHKLTMKK